MRLENNKEKEFAQILEKVTRLAREQKNVISEQQVKDAFAQLQLTDAQLDQIFDYLKKHNVGIDEPVDPDEYLRRDRLSAGISGKPCRTAGSIGSRKGRHYHLCNGRG